MAPWTALVFDRIGREPCCRTGGSRTGQVSVAAHSARDPVPAGGPTDMMGRLYGERLSALLGQPV